MSGFIEHGSIDVHIDDRILCIQGEGPWNLEAVQQAQNKYSPLVDTLRGKAWGTIVALKGDPIYVPDAADFLVKTIQKERQQGCVATAILVGESNSPEFAKRHLSELHSRANDVFSFFSNQQEAEQWLAQKISFARLH